MYVEYAVVKCPSCGKGVDVHFMHLSSLIGPPEVECWWCHSVVKTERIEWWEMASQAKMWFIGVSLLYAALGYFLGGLSTRTAIDFLKTGQWRNEWGLDEPAFWIGGGVWVLFVVLLQLYRVNRSIQRKGETVQKPARLPFWSLQVGGQWKVIIMLLLIPALCWLSSLVREFPHR